MGVLGDGWDWGARCEIPQESIKIMFFKKYYYLEKSEVDVSIFLTLSLENKLQNTAFSATMEAPICFVTKNSSQRQFQCLYNDPLCGCHSPILNMTMPGVLVTCLKQNHHVFSLNKLRRSYAAHPDAHLSCSSLLHNLPGRVLYSNGSLPSTYLIE